MVCSIYLLQVISTADDNEEDLHIPVVDGHRTAVYRPGQVRVCVCVCVCGGGGGGGGERHLSIDTSMTML